MGTERDTLEDTLQDYEQRLRGLNSYLKELKDRVAEHGTPEESLTDDLTEAGHNIAYYEGEIARIKGELGEAHGSATYYVYCDAAGEWRWRLRAGNNRIIADSGEGYKDKRDCHHGIDLVKGSQGAHVKESDEHE